MKTQVLFITILFCSASVCAELAPLEREAMAGRQLSELSRAGIARRLSRLSHRAAWSSGLSAGRSLGRTKKERRQARLGRVWKRTKNRIRDIFSAGSDDPYNGAID